MYDKRWRFLNGILNNIHAYNLQDTAHDNIQYDMKQQIDDGTVFTA